MNAAGVVSAMPAMARGSAIVPLLLAVACVASGLVVVEIEHDSRSVTAQLTHQRRLRDELHLQYAQLQLEQATLGGHSRVQKLAQQQFDMVEPKDYVIVKPRPPVAGGRP